MFIALGRRTAPAPDGAVEPASPTSPSSPACCSSSATPRSRPLSSSPPARCCTRPVSGTSTGSAASCTHAVDGRRLRRRRARRGRAAGHRRLRRRVGAAAGAHPRRGQAHGSPRRRRDAGRGGAGGAHRGAGTDDFVKAFGIAFLARPRSAEAAGRAREPAPTMRVAMVHRGCLVVVLGLVPGPRGSAGGHCGGGLDRCRGRRACGGIDLPCVGAVLDPVALALLAARDRRSGGRRLGAGLATPAPAARSTSPGAAAGCGSARGCSTPRRPTPSRSCASSTTRCARSRDVEVTHAGRVPLPRRARCSSGSSVGDVVETRLYRPVIAGADRRGRRSPAGCRTAASTATSAYSFVACWSCSLVVSL